MIRPRLLHRKLNRTPHRALRPVQKQIYPRNVLVNETNGLKLDNYSREILPWYRQVHVFGVPYGFPIHARNPCGNRIATNDDVGDSRYSQCGAAKCPLANVFHGRNHPFPREVL